MATESIPEWVRNAKSGYVYRIVRLDADYLAVHYVNSCGFVGSTKYGNKPVLFMVESKEWIPCERPADAIAPKYGLTEEERPEWVINNDTGTAYRLEWPKQIGDHLVNIYYVDGRRRTIRVNRSAQEAIDFLDRRLWIPCKRPADASAPNYGLAAEEKPLCPEWIIEDGVIARLCWSEMADFDGKKFVPVKLVDGDGGKYAVSMVESELKSGKWKEIERPKDAIGKAYGLFESTGSKDSPTPGMPEEWFDVPEGCEFDPDSMEHEIVTLRRKHAELLTIVETLLTKHDPDMLAAIRKSHGSSDPDKP